LENDEQKLLKGGCATSFWKSLTFFFQVSKKLLTNQDKCFLLWYPNSKHVFFINTLKCGYGNIVMCLQEYAFI